MSRARITLADQGCLNGWGPGAFDKSPPCTSSYTGGHYCERAANHPGRCRCDCGSTHAAPATDAKDAT